MKATVIRPDPATEFYTAERCHILELSNTANDEAMSIARARVEPGVATAFHKVIGTAERYLILSGEGVVEVAGQAPTKVDRGDVVLIPPGRRRATHYEHRSDRPGVPGLMHAPVSPGKLR